MAETPPTNDPAPWMHADGGRFADPLAPGTPAGGYTFSPRREYADYPDRYISTDRRNQR